MLEKEVERLLVAGIRASGGRAYKFVSPGNAGVPDRIVVLPGRVIFVELKTAAGRTTELQDVQIARLKGLGQDVRVLHGREEVEKFLWEVQE